MKKTSGQEYIASFLKLIGIGTAILLTIVFIFGYFTSKEYPKLQHEDSLNYVVLKVSYGRGVAHVDFENKKKFTLPWAQNFHYQEFPSLSGIVSNGDLIYKKSYSDTVWVTHLGKQYLYVLNKVIDN